MGLLFGDNIEIHHTTAAPAYPQTVHEHRAPTDDSVKLLREMEETSKESIIGSVLIEDNTLNGLVVIFNMQPMVMARVAYIRFTFNGKEHVVKKELDHRFEWEKPEGKTEAVRMLFDEVMKQVGNDIWPATIKALLSNTRQVPERG
jgi:hypothetical protein